MVEVTRETLVRKIRETKGKFFTVVFLKKSNNQRRVMNCRLGVKKFLKPDAKPRVIAPKIVNVWDLYVGKQDPDNAYRCFDTETLISANIGGETYVVSEKTQNVE